jgi:hypothetical protein
MTSGNYMVDADDREWLESKREASRQRLESTADDRRDAMIEESEIKGGEE